MLTSIIYAVRRRQFEAEGEARFRHRYDGWRFDPVAEIGHGQANRPEAQVTERAFGDNSVKLDPAGAEGPDGFDVGEIDLAEIALHLENRVADEAALDGEGEIAGRLDDQVGGGRAKVRFGEAVEFGGPVGFFGESPIGCVGECLSEGGVPVPGELGEQGAADAVAGEPRRFVAGVLTPVDAALAEGFADLFAGEVK
jgi:hypothetical protein